MTVLRRIFIFLSLRFLLFSFDQTEKYRRVESAYEWRLEISFKAWVFMMLLLFSFRSFVHSFFRCRCLLDNMLHFFLLSLCCCWCCFFCFLYNHYSSSTTNHRHAIVSFLFVFSVQLWNSHDVYYSCLCFFFFLFRFFDARQVIYTWNRWPSASERRVDATRGETTMLIGYSHHVWGFMIHRLVARASDRLNVCRIWTIC